MSDEEEIKSEIESLSEPDGKLKKLRERQEENENTSIEIREMLGTGAETEEIFKKLRKEDKETRSKIREILEVDEKIGGIRSKIMDFEGESSLSRKAGMETYDTLKFGPLIEEKRTEVDGDGENYWIERPYVMAKISREKETGEYRYHLIEPQLTEEEEEEKRIIWEELKNRLPYTQIKGNKQELLGETFREILEDRGLRDHRKIHRILYYLVRDNLGYGKIDGLMRDEAIEDISCDGINVPIYIYHQDFYNTQTDIRIKEEELNSFVNKLAEKAGSHISYADPVVEATLPEGSRLQAALGSEVTTRGSSFTIRKFGGGSFTPVDLIRYGTFDPEMLATIWIAIENGKSIMVVGGTASGKTSTLNAFAFFIPPDAKIVSIEDTRELSLYQDNWLPNLTRESGEGEKLDMQELVKKAMRQRPEAILVGEVRGREALAMFQAISTGHTGFSTMHAGSIQDAVNRLVGEPINLPKPMLAELDMLCLQLLTNLEEKRVRKNKRVVEFLGMEPESKNLKITETFKWERGTDSFKKMEESQILREIREDQGMSMPEMSKEIENRSKLLRKMVEESIISYGKIASLIRQYYFNPEKALKKATE